MKRSILEFLTLMTMIVMLIVLFGVFVRYPDTGATTSFLTQPYVQHVGLFVLLGLGLRFSALERLAWSSLGAAYLVTAVCALYFVLWNGLWAATFGAGFNGEVRMTVTLLVDVYRAGAVGVIACAAALGTVSLLENMIFGCLLMITYTLNKQLLERIVGIIDDGGAITIHLFAGVAGLVYAKLLRSSYADNHPLNRKSYSNYTFALIGTVIMFVFYPSFNAGVTSGFSRQLCLMNTVIALSGSFLSAMGVGFYYSGKLDPNLLINGGLAGAIAVASTATFTINPSIAFFEGSVAGLVIGFLNTFVEKRINGFDSLGVLIGHGFAGLLGALFSIVFLLGYQLTVYPTIQGAALTSTLLFGKLAGTQFVGILITILISGLTAMAIGWLLQVLGFRDRLEDELLLADRTTVLKVDENGKEYKFKIVDVIENHFYDDIVDYNVLA